MAWQKCLLHNYSEPNPATGNAVEWLRTPFTHLEGWIGLGLLILFFLNFRFIKHFLLLSFPGLIHFHVAQKQFEENSVLIANIRRFLLIFSQVCLSFFLFLAIRYYDAFPAHLTTAQVYVFILLSFFVFYILKTFLLRILGFLTETETAMRMMGYYGQLYAIAGGIMLFPLTLLFFNTYSPFCKLLIVTGLICALVMALLYLVRSFQIFISYKLSVFFWILYLCTFEFAPFLFIWKYITLA
ncbi:MAG: DUF4271 domain-containing protein [Prevotellaceae bacterium]|jgi:hypothetical protein|nr:DUF4271 domain-containing protein [Prevotellaceae bacterium]